MIERKQRNVLLDDERWDSLSSHPISPSAAIREGIDLWIMLRERADKRCLKSRHGISIDGQRWGWLARHERGQSAAIREAIDLWNLWREHIEVSNEMA